MNARFLLVAGIFICQKQSNLVKAGSLYKTCKLVLLFYENRIRKTRIRCGEKCRGMQKNAEVKTNSLMILQRIVPIRYDLLRYATICFNMSLF